MDRFCTLHACLYSKLEVKHFNFVKIYFHTSCSLTARYSLKLPPVAIKIEEQYEQGQMPIRRGRNAPVTLTLCTRRLEFW